MKITQVQKNNRNNQYVAEIFKLLQKSNPFPTTELEYNNAFQLLVAVVLSAQATDKGVNKATSTLFEIVTSPEEMLELGENGLIEYIRSIGLYKAKAKNIIKLSEQLVEDYNSEIPSDFDELIKLAGVGRKTANVILNTLFNQPTIAVDTHVFRVSRRIGLALSDKIEEVEQELLSNIPKEYIMNAHHWIILHGRYICKARNPECHNCIISSYCDFYEKNK